MEILGIALALASAAVWGAGDFSGGLAARRASPYQVLTLSGSSGIVLLIASAVLRRESLPSMEVIVWASLAGLSGTVGLGCLYRGLSLGNAAMVAPTAAVVTAALPVLFTLAIQGRPSMPQSAGFLVAMAGIWLVAGPAASIGGSRNGFKLALLAGIGFGGFLVLLGQVPAGPVFVPAAIARVVMLVVVLGRLWTTDLALPNLTSNRAALIAGVFDAGGNVFYLFAREYTRLDVAAVLSSLYPVTTVLLAHLVLKEPVSRLQWLGMAVCLAAVALITVN
jgi:drug/metabolite transporter (DMT)-like permease